MVNLKQLLLVSTRYSIRNIKDLCVFMQICELEDAKIFPTVTTTNIVEHFNIPYSSTKKCLYRLSTHNHESRGQSLELIFLHGSRGGQIPQCIKLTRKGKQLKKLLNDIG